MLSIIEHLKTGPIMDSKNANQSNQDRCFRKSRMKTCLIFNPAKNV